MDGQSPLKRRRVDESEVFAAGTDEIGPESHFLNKGNTNRIIFIADGGATEHVINNSDYFAMSEVTTKQDRIKSANKDKNADLIVERRGDVRVKVKNGRILRLRNVLYSSSAARNLFSLRKLTNNLGVKYALGDDGIKIFDSQNEVIKTGNYDGRFWWLNFEFVKLYEKRDQRQGRVEGTALYNEDQEQEGETDHSYSRNKSGKGDHSYARDEPMEVSYKNISDMNDLQEYSSTVSEMEVSDLIALEKKKVASLRDNIGLLWHYRLNHISKQGLEEAAKTIKELKGVKFTNMIIDCDTCKMCKIQHKPSNTTRDRCKKPLQLIHSDLIGPISPKTFEYGCRYIVTFIDDFTRFAWAYALYDKTTVHIALERMLECV
jgi:hypothetical protein